ncbi:hypothetical protein [Halalkalibacterium ligniniphilum]|uniref:hypothetical protein n=1 Tax=Halalkalibacterium ligniniphilum TaxID=1134413 RepID=UPI000345B322|nr:hypothetical protein [Halalkalibacterium ligniniphilum]
MWIKNVCSLLIIGCLMFCSCVPVFAKENEQANQLVLVLAPSLSFQEARWLTEHGKYKDLWEQAVLSAMNVRPDGPYSYLNNTVSLSMGNRGVGVKGWNSFEPGEKIDEQPAEFIMQQWYGHFPEKSLLHPYVNRLVEKNKQSTYGGQVGILGSLLERQGVKRVVIGHSDINERVRYGSLFTMNEKGESSGVLTKAVRSNPRAPFGQEMDEAYVMQMLESNDNELRFTVVEWGDVFRLYEQREMMDIQYFNVQRSHQLLRLESFIHKLYTEKKYDIWLVAPFMHQEAYQEKEQLAPIFFWGQKGGGAFYSPTTRQVNLMSNIDFVPTILSYYNIPIPSSLSGNPVKLQTGERFKPATVYKTVDHIVYVFKTRGSVLSSYISLLVLLLIVGGGVTWFKRESQRWCYVMQVILSAAVSTPLWFLVLTPLAPFVHPAGFVVLLMLCSVGSAYMATRWFASPIVVIGTVQFVLISIDVMLGSPFMQRSYLGYDPIIGARYYGIGNEYAGVYIISALLALSPFLNRKNKWVRGCILLVFASFTLIMLGKSTLGANAGATLSAGISFVMIGYWLFCRRWAVWKLLLALGASMLLIIYFLYMLQLSGAHTHIQKAFIRLFQGDFHYISNLILRKVEMNVKLFRFSNWTQLFVTSYVLVGVFLWKQCSTWEHEGRTLLLQGGLVASVALFLLNDSGVIAAATSMFLVVSANLFWLLEYGGNKGGEHVAYKD